MNINNKKMESKLLNIRSQELGKKGEVGGKPLHVISWLAWKKIF